jgi:hypothetical protein
MDPTSVEMISAVLSGLISGGAGVAGAAALESFGRLRRRAGAGDGPPSTPEDAVSVAERVVASANDDAQLASDLAEWLRESQAILASITTVTNSVSGVVIGSSVVQTGISTRK